MAKQDELDENAPLLTVTTNKYFYEPTETIKVEAKVNKKRLPEETKINLSAKTIINNQKIKTIQLDEDSNIYYSYSTTFTPEIDGRYKIEVSVEAEGKSLADESTEFTVGKPFQELDKLNVDEDLLRDIATQTNGQFYNIVNANEVTKDISQLLKTEKIRVEKGIADTPIFFIAFLIFATIDWLIRRHKELI